MLLPKRVKYRRVHRGRMTGKAMRVGHTEKDGKKVRVCKKCGAEF